MKSITDSQGGLGEAQLGVDGRLVHEGLGMRKPVRQRSLTQIGDVAAKFAKLVIAASNVSAELGAAQSVTFGCIIDRSL